MTLEITSSSNKHIKYIKLLHKRKYREKNDEFIVEGLRIIEHAINNDAKISGVYYSDEITNTDRGRRLIERMSLEGVNLYKVSEKIFKEISTTDTPQGILGVVKRKHYSLRDVIDKEKFLLIILDRLRDPGNVGTIIRTADAAGVDAVAVLKGTVDIYNSKTIRSTMGSIFTLPIIHVEDTASIISALKLCKADIISTTLGAEKYHFEVEYGSKNAVIIGNEAEGISHELIRHSNIKVKIPVIGNAESLNASIASGIIMYELVKQHYFS